MSDAMEFPIRTSTRTGLRQYRRVRCVICETTKVKTVKSVKLPGTDPPVTLRYCRCTECKDLRGNPTTFKVTIR